MVNFKSVVKTDRDAVPPPLGRTSSAQSSAKAQAVSYVRSGQQTRHRAPPRPRPRPRPRPGEDSQRRTTSNPVVIVAATAAARSCRDRETAIEEEAEDVIDLGAPRWSRQPRPRRLTACPASPGLRPRPVARRALPPNPRLYPGAKPTPRVRRSGGTADASRARRRKRRPRPRPVPNSRLYRPAPARPPAPPPPPPARPRATWPAPAPPRALDTASRAALRLAPPPALCAPFLPPPERARRLVVTLALPETAPRYRPASEHFRARAAAESSADVDSGESTPPAARLRPRQPPPSAAMEAAGRQSTSPEDRSDGNETLSAPSEFLAEFLSAIMRRQYAEALKYCRLILQYEPRNATARGFYPLLRRRTEVAAAAAGGGSPDSSGDEAAGPGESPLPARQVGVNGPASEPALRSSINTEERSAESGGDGESDASAAGDHSELELDSSSEPGAGDTADSASGAGWDSAASGERSEAADDNGNAPSTPAHTHLLPDDLENDNGGAGAGGGEPNHATSYKSEAAPAAASSLRRLRAHFACSIK